MAPSVSEKNSGPLKGLRLLEFASIGPAPFGVMLLADLGAEVVRIERADAPWPDVPVVSRGRASLSLDLKSKRDKAKALDIISAADVLVEGFRPGVMERIGLGPNPALDRNSKLIYARMTGWGQAGPLAQVAGHDINFIGLSGMLALLAPEGERPVAPLNLLGDYGGGGLYLAFGILAALWERQRSGRGQVIDTAILDGSLSLLAPIIGMVAAGLLPHNPSGGMLSGQELFYRTYACSDGRFVAVGALEPAFRRQLTDRLGLSATALDDPTKADEIEALFATRTRDEWAALFEGSDCCVSPVLDLDEAARHPQVAQRQALLKTEGQLQPGVAPRFSRTPGSLSGEGDAVEQLSNWGIDMEGRS